MWLHLTIQSSEEDSKVLSRKGANCFVSLDTASHIWADSTSAIIVTANGMELKTSERDEIKKVLAYLDAHLR